MDRDVEVGEQAVALEDHADVALVGRHAHDVGTADGDTAGVGLLEAGGDAQGGGLAAPGRAEQAHQLARLEGEVERLERDGRAERLADGVELEGRGHRLHRRPGEHGRRLRRAAAAAGEQGDQGQQDRGHQQEQQAEGEAALHLAQGELLVERRAASP